jgi:hypothetical protein
MAPAQTIDAVIAQLTRIVEQSRARGSCDGYFAALYREVTTSVRDHIGRGWFEDGPRMERFDVIFANRYLEAWARHEAGGPDGAAWGVAFRADQAFWPVVLQHLLLGMNAHINFDLGLAAATAAPGAAIEELKPDFDRINQLLAGLVNDVENRLARVWPPLRRLDGLAGGTDEAVIKFSMRCARDFAWSLATALAAETDPVARAVRVREADACAAVIGQGVLHPGFSAGLILKWVRLRERGSVADKLAMMSG